MSTFDESDLIPAISGNDVIMAYGGSTKSLNSILLYQNYGRQPGSNRLCSCFFWSRYFLFFINLMLLFSGIALIGFGSWTLLNDDGLQLFESILYAPSCLLLSTGSAMIVVAILGCVGTWRYDVICLRVFMVMVVGSCVLQVALGALVFFRMDDLDEKMLDVSKDAVTKYNNDDDSERDKQLDSLQKNFDCCGASSFTDWETNIKYSCDIETHHVFRCGVPVSCCRGATDPECGSEVRDGTEEYTEMFSYTRGCVVEIIKIVRGGVTVVGSITFGTCVLQMCCLFLANKVTKMVVHHRKPLT